jgi:leucyl/phenylalanyl-tRNA--protein transferase
MIVLDQNIWFPEVEEATEEGLLAIGGDLSTARLLLAYKSGIFPWYDEDSPLLWWSPDPRFVLFPDKLKVSKSMKQLLNKKVFEVTYNTCFERVITSCANQKRKGQRGTWITQEMLDAYCKLHELGYAKSVEVWKDKKLVGGLYGVDLHNGVFCGESMFTLVPNASKYGFITFVQQNEYKLFDCQVYTEHLKSLGAQDIDRDSFLSYL